MRARRAVSPLIWTVVHLNMEHQFESGDIVVGVLAAAGVVVLIVVFVWVFRQVMSRDGE
ncbi:hypothetical protein [Nitrospira sp. Nam80]